MTKRTILITGCSDGGLGAALAIALHESGWRVFATARNPTKMSTLTAAGIETLTLDVQSHESRLAVVGKIAELTGGSLDALLNNAGGGYSMPLVDADLEQSKKLFDLNVWSLLSLTQEILPLLRKSQKGAVIMNHSSVAALVPLPFQGVYSASKAAVSMLSDALRLELAPFGIKVVDIKSAIVSSQFFTNITANDFSTKLPENSIYQPAREPVQRVLNGIVSGRPVSETGQDARSWAEEVVRDLNKDNPPRQIMRGGWCLVYSVGIVAPAKRYRFFAEEGDLF